MSQGSVASCDWFACTYYQMTYTRNRLLDQAASPSTSLSPKFGFTMINNANTFPLNMWFADVYQFLAKHGAPTLAELPYDLTDGEHFKEWTSNYQIWESALTNKVSSYASKAFTVDNARRALQAGEILVCQLNVGAMHYGETIDFPTRSEDDSALGQKVILSGANGPDHTVAIVGYNDLIWVDSNQDGLASNNELGAFKIAESYFDGNDNAGFRWLAYGAVDNPQTSVIWDKLFWTITMDIAYQPKLLVQLTLRASQREALHLELGYSSKADSNFALAQPSTSRYQPSGWGFQPGASGKSLTEGGNCNFDGLLGESEASFCFDVSEMYQTSQAPGYWFLRLRNDAETPVSISAFSILDTKTGQSINLKQPGPVFQNAEKVIFLPNQ
jgi:hypothetical protein